MAEVEFKNVNKVFDGGVHAVRDLSLRIKDGEFLVMVGPSGCGKSTLLRMVAGLDEVTEGTLKIGGKTVNGIPPQERNIAMVFQNYALYPHKSVRKNLEFPLKMMKLKKTEIAKRVDKAARLLGLHEYLDRKPKQLSGGQRQRVAMGRAIVRDPQVFLMDEPLSNLDAKMRVEIRAEIADLQRKIGITTLYVTHDQVEAMTLGERVAVLKNGVLQQVGPAQEIYDHPANVFVASFIGSPGMNIFHAQLQHRDEGCAIRIGKRELPVDAKIAESLNAFESLLGQPLLIGFRPEAVFDPETVPEEQRLELTVAAAEALGHELIVYVESPVDLYEETEASLLEDEKSNKKTPSLVVRLPAGPCPRKGETITLGIDTAKLHFFTEDGKALKSISP
jgi:multiple sugar transport system ATP-binding protein